jgi:asparagine synthase (glutamine-hydrolysing)
MYGIVGYYKKKSRNNDYEKTLLSMMDIISHRGPDESNYWIDSSHLIGFGHVRLSIVDLEKGLQPIFNEDRSIAVIFNGEIYNYKELKKELLKKGHIFYTNTDTEVIVHLYEESGEAFVESLRGMFAIALWDSNYKKLILARDHIGKKPLFYCENNDEFYFASEYKSFLTLKHFNPKLDYESLHYFLNLRWLPAEKTLLKGVKQILPGQIAIIKDDSINFYKYFTLTPNKEIRILSEKEHRENIIDLLTKAIDKRLMGDVPVGLFLSAGIDSSAIIGLMDQEYRKKLFTYTMGFGDNNDEIEDATETANFYGSIHTNFLSKKHPMEYFEKTIWHTEIPKTNSIQLYMLSKLASKSIKVVLSGLGGDELFGGYDNYLFIKYGKYFTNIPFKNFGTKLRKMIFKLLKGGKNLKFDQYRRGLEMCASFSDRSIFYSILRNVWDMDTDMYDIIYSKKIAHLQKEFNVCNYFNKCFDKDDFLFETMICELQEKIVGDQILIEDRNMMAHGIEGRAPFLDIDLVKYSINIPSNLKINLMGRKVIFRKALKNFLPSFIFQRKKNGFAFNPYIQFMRDFKKMAQALLSKEIIEEMGLFNYDYIDRIINHPPHRNLHWHYWQLWILMGFTIWYKQFIKKDL